MVELDYSFKPVISPAGIGDIEVIKSRGPWETRSKAKLNVLFALPFERVGEFFQYHPSELAFMPQNFDIKGLRAYSVRGLHASSPPGSVEFHRIRKELVFAIDGAVDFPCEDVKGNKATFRLDAQIGIYLPPFILHTYQSRQDNSGLLVVCNTLFNPDDKRTQDTYPIEVFRKLQEHYK